MQIPPLILLLLVVSLASGQDTCRCVEPENDGYLLCSCKKTWAQAERYCAQAYKGKLALVTNANIQEKLRKLLNDNGAQDTWIGANGTKTDWTWVTDEMPISYQGCYQDDATNRDLSFDIALGLDVTPKKCIDECRKARDPREGPPYKYAALQSGSMCTCGDTYGRYGFSSSCSNPCIGDFNQNCGGPQSNQVYRTEALDSGGWAFGSPSSGSGGIDDKECMVYKCETYLGWTWQNEKCERKFKFLCMYDYNNSTCKLRNKIPTAEACIGYDETEEASWFLASEKCQESGGRLLEIPTEISHNSIREVLEDKCWLANMWLGATKINWRWNTRAPLAYTNWANAMPQNEGDKCVAMSYRVSFDYEWRDLSCDSQQSFVCQKPSIPLITAPTRRPTTTTTTSRTKPTSAGTTAAAGPSTTATVSTRPTSKAISTSKRTTPSPRRTPESAVTTLKTTPFRDKSTTTVSSTLFASSLSTILPEKTTKRVEPPIRPIPTEPGFPQQTTKKGKSPGNGQQPGDTPQVGNKNGTLVTEAPPYQPGDNIPVYIGIAVAIAAFLIIVAIIIYCCCIRSKKREEKMAPARIENGYSNRAGFVHDGDFAYSNITPTPPNGVSNGVIIDKNGYDQPDYKPVLDERLPPAYDVAPDVAVMATKPMGSDVVDDRTATMTSVASSDIGHHRDVSDTASVNSASSAFIGELDDQNVSIEYVHPRDENEEVRRDPSHQPTLPRELGYTTQDTTTDAGFIEPIANPHPAGTNQASRGINSPLDQGPNEMHITKGKADLTTRL